MTQHEFEVFFDGDCPLCMREIRFLRNRDTANRIQFTNIAAESFDAASVGVDHPRLLAAIHGRLPDGSLVKGVEVFRNLYALTGFSFLVRVSRLPGIRHMLDVAYSLFAKYRLRITGRCEDGSCRVPASTAKPQATSQTS